MWEQARLNAKKDAIAEVIKEGGRITRLLPAPEVAFNSSDYLASFSEILCTGDPFSVVYIIKAISSSMNEESVVQKMLDDLDILIQYEIPTNIRALVDELLQEMWDESQVDSCGGARVRTFMEKLRLAQEI